MSRINVVAVLACSILLAGLVTAQSATDRTVAQNRIVGNECLQLLFSNPYMPAEIRWSHLVETLGSTLTFGFGVGWLLSHPGAIAMKTPSPSSSRPW